MPDTLALKNDDSTSVGTLIVDTISSDTMATTKVSTGADGVDGGFVTPSNRFPVTTFNTVKDGSGTEYAGLVDSDGHQQVDVLNTVSISGTVDLGATDNAVLDSIVSALGGTLTVDGSGVTQPVSGTVTANLGATDNAVLDAIQAAVEGTLTVDGSGVTQPVSASSLPLPTGASTAANQSTANSALSAIQSAVEGTLTVGSHAVTNAGTFVVQINGDALTALQTIDNIVVADDAAYTAGSGVGVAMMGFASSDTVDSGDIGVLAMDTSRRLLVSIEADNVGIGGGTQYTEDDAVPSNPVGNAILAQRDDALGGLTPAEGDWSHLFVDANGALWVNVNNTVSVSGTVTANLGATDNAVLDAIQAAVEGTLTVGSHAVTNAGTFAVQVDGDALTALQLLDDAIYSDDADWSDGSSKHILVGGLYQSSPQSITDGDVGPFQVTANGYLITSISGTVTVDGSGVTQPVSGTVTANLSATDNTVLDNIQTAVDTVAAAVSTEMQCDIVGSLPAGTNAIGKLAANSGVDIGDVDVTSVPSSISGPGNPVVDSYSTVAISASANTANQSLVSAPGANKQIWVYGVMVTADTNDGSVSFQDEDDTAISGVIAIAENGGFSFPVSGNFAMPLWKVDTNKGLEIDTVTCGAKGFLQYGIIDVS